MSAERDADEAKMTSNAPNRRNILLGGSTFAAIYTSSMRNAQAQPAPAGQAPATAQQQKPNVVFILSDNVGYGDLGSYGGGELRGAPTPRLDQLATEGLRLTQYLVEPGCTPSRAALLTGQYSIRNGLRRSMREVTSRSHASSTSADLAPL
jgi:hypothetical protein